MKKRNFFVVVAVLVFVLMFSTAALAKSKRPFKDVTRKKVDAQSYDAIVYINNFGGWRGLTKKGKFYPNKAITRREFLIVLQNLYGDKIDTSMQDVRYANSKITSKFACDRMVVLSKKLGYPIRWNGNKSRLKRKDAARYIKIFATFHKALTPKKASSSHH